MPSKSPNYCFTLAYDGTRFEGWQRQSRSRTVQGELEAALQKITGRKVKIIGAGRTDSGVHAESQVAHAAVRTRLSPAVLQRALNAVLPPDILIRSIRTAPSAFHARYDARSKHYRYTIWNHPLRPLFERDRAHHVPDRLNLRAMRRAARALPGKRDFAAFGSPSRPRQSTVRNLHRLSLRRQGPKILIDAEGNGFLYHMVRRIAGLLIQVGKGRWPPEAAGALLRGESERVAPTAPARGLCLVKVRY